MNWTKKQILDIVADLAEENAFACQALFKISTIEFTEECASLCVSLEDKPQLSINKKFLDRHAQTENDVRAVLLHEFLHVVLRHTEKYETYDYLLNVALDAIINAILHRNYGSKYSDFFCRLYPWEEEYCLLRTFPEGNAVRTFRNLYDIHCQIYNGNLAADDLFELLKFLKAKGMKEPAKGTVFIGSHVHQERPVSPKNKKMLKEILARMDGTGIWSRPGLRGNGDRLKHEDLMLQRKKQNTWNRETSGLLQDSLMEDKRMSRDAEVKRVQLPFLSTNDRKAIAVLSWSGILPMAENDLMAPKKAQTANIYLDVSGSMNEELELMIPMLYRLRNFIHLPLWTFSDTVSPAKFKNGKLHFETSGGTVMASVFDHIRKHRSKKNLIITDGYVESITPEMLREIDTQKLRCIISASGNPGEFFKNDISYFQLKTLPK